MNILQAIALAFCLAGSAAAAKDSPPATASNPMAPVGLVLLVLCVIRRKSAIGGWLLYFFAYVFLDGISTIVTVVQLSDLYGPAYWHGSHLYLPFLLASLPPMIIIVLLSLTVVTIVLVRTRDWEWIVRLRLLLAALIIADLIRLGIYYAFFPASAFTMASRAIIPIAFLSYLFRSSRVRRVFLTRDWEESPAAGYLDLAPRKGIVYTQSELDAMKSRRGEP